MTAKMSATRAAEPNAESRPIKTPVPGVVSVLLLFVLLLSGMASGWGGNFRRVRWLVITDIVGEGGGQAGVCGGDVVEVGLLGAGRRDMSLAVGGWVGGLVGQRGEVGGPWR